MLKPSRPRSGASSRALNCVTAAALFVFAALAGHAFGFTYVTSDASRWPGPTIPMVVQLGSAPRTLQDGSVSYDQSVERAMKLWNQQIARAQITWTEAPRSGPPSANGVTTISFETKIYNDDLGSRTLAITQVRASGGRIIETDIAFNSRLQWDSYFGTLDGQLNEEIHRVALHELGHALGLDHPDQARQIVSAVMNSHVSDVERLQADDVSGVQSLYGANATAPALDRNGRLSSISTRGRVSSGEAVMIGGFEIKDGTKRVLIRGIGPSLPLPNDLADPVLTLYNRNGDVIASNDNWKESQRAEIETTGYAPRFDSESAIVATLPPEPFTAIVSGKSGTSGVALVEVYNLTPESGRLASISTRGYVGTGDDVLIGGFIIEGPEPKTVVLRGIGPSLSAYGVTNPLPATSIQLFNGNSVPLTSNTGWQNGNGGFSTGLTPPDPRESALSSTLAPGAYTVILRGANDATGIGLVEIYDVSP